MPSFAAGMSGSPTLRESELHQPATATFSERVAVRAASLRGLWLLVAGASCPNCNSFRRGRSHQRV